MRQIRMVLLSGTASCFLALSGSLSTQPSAAYSAPGPVAPPPPPAPPNEITLTGLARDFREKSVTGGHPDFEADPDKGFGQYSGNVRPALGDDGKPVWVGGGKKVSSQWKDKNGRPIAYDLFSAAKGDVAGTWGAISTGGVKDAASFNQWFQDVPGVNLSMPLALHMVRGSDGSYVFDDKSDPEYTSKGGFFPLDNQLFGNSTGTPDHNFHFTFELHTEFTYDASADQVFRFVGDDDVYVFIDNRLVIDLGGVHSAVEQFVDLNRLGLTSGETYHLDFFFAERHRTQSNFRIQTNIVLSTPDAVPTVNSGFD